MDIDETLENVIAKLSDSKIYRDQFTRVYGSDEIMVDKRAKALEQFMFSIVSYDSKYAIGHANDSATIFKTKFEAYSFNRLAFILSNS